MKKLLSTIAVMFMVFIGYNAPASAGMTAGSFGVTSLSGAVGIGTEPVSGFGTGFGVGVGAAFYDLKDMDIEVRADLSYQRWSETIWGVDVTISRIPVIVSGRKYFPMNETTRLYGQGGVGISIDDIEVAVCIGSTCESASVSETNFDIVPAVGVQFKLSPVLSLGAEAGYHVVSDPYFSLLGTVSYSLGK